MKFSTITTSVILVLSCVAEGHAANGRYGGTKITGNAQHEWGLPVNGFGLNSLSTDPDSMIMSADFGLHCIDVDGNHFVVDLINQDEFGGIDSLEGSETLRNNCSYDPRFNSYCYCTPGVLVKNNATDETWWHTDYDKLPEDALMIRYTTTGGWDVSVNGIVPEDKIIIPYWKQNSAELWISPTQDAPGKVNMYLAPWVI